MGMQDGVATDTPSKATTALAVSGVAVVLYIVAMIVAQDSNEWLWPLSGVVGLVGAVMGWAAGKPRPQGRALAAVVLGGLVFLTVLGWIIWAMATGNM